MKPMIKVTIPDKRIQFAEHANVYIDFPGRKLHINVPFGDTDQYRDIATLEVMGIDNDPSLINKPSFTCKLSMSRKGKLELTY